MTSLWRHTLINGWPIEPNPVRSLIARRGGDLGSPAVSHRDADCKSLAEPTRPPSKQGYSHRFTRRDGILAGIRNRRLWLVIEQGPLLSARAWNIGLRTAHIGITGVLLGGHVFHVSRERLFCWLVASILSGIALTVVEAWSGWKWFYQGRGLFVLAKLLLLGLIPWFWHYRVTLLVAVVAIGSIGSHMPGRFRYYSVVHRR